MPLFSKGLRELLFGNPFGEVYPPKANPDPLPEDGRTAALRIFRRYISELTFFRLGGLDAQGTREAPIPFRIPPKNIYIEWPDNEDDLVFPSIVFLSSGTAEYVPIGLTSYVEEETKDVHGYGTVVQWMSEYTEKFTLEIWSSKRSERRAILSGLEVALTPTEQMYGLRFRMPDYFNELVCFTVESREIIDEPDAARNRRRARLTIEMRFNVVAIVNYNSLSTVLKTEVDVDEDTNLAIDVDEEGPLDRRPNNLPRGPLGPTTPFDEDC